MIGSPLLGSATRPRSWLGLGPGLRLGLGLEHISLYLPISPHISPYLLISPYISAALLRRAVTLYLPISPDISLYLPISPYISAALLRRAVAGLRLEHDVRAWGDVRRYRQA